MSGDIAVPGTTAAGSPQHRPRCAPLTPTARTTTPSSPRAAPRDCSPLRHVTPGGRFKSRTWTERNGRNVSGEPGAGSGEPGADGRCFGRLGFGSCCVWGWGAFGGVLCPGVRGVVWCCGCCCPPLGKVPHPCGAMETPKSSPRCPVPSIPSPRCGLRVVGEGNGAGGLHGAATAIPRCSPTLGGERAGGDVGGVTWGSLLQGSVPARSRWTSSGGRTSPTNTCAAWRRPSGEAPPSPSSQTPPSFEGGGSDVREERRLKKSEGCRVPLEGGGWGGLPFPVSTNGGAGGGEVELGATPL